MFVLQEVFEEVFMTLTERQTCRLADSDEQRSLQTQITMVGKQNLFFSPC